MVKLTHPQPVWQDGIVFAQHFHPIQIVPYLFGIVLLLGFLLFFSALPEANDVNTLVFKRLCYFFAGLYAVLIFINYFLQLAIIPNFLAHPDVISAFASDNAYSLFWYIEMVGYAFLGLATWSCSVLFPGKGVYQTLRWLLILNGVTSIFSGIWNFVQPGWVFSSFGIISYVLWNLLIILIMIWIIRIRKQEIKQAQPH